MSATQLTHVRVHGLGLTDDFLLQLSDRAQTSKVEQATPASYGLPPKTPLEEAILDAWDDARKAWNKFQTHSTDPWAGWVRPLLRALEYSFAGQGATGGKYTIRHLAETGDVPLHFTTARDHTPDLDRVTEEMGIRASPHGTMQGYLNATPEHQWGIVTNGETLRLLRDNAQVTRAAYAEFDLGEMMRTEDARAFRVLWLLLHRSRLKGGKTSIIESWNTKSGSEGVKARDGLRNGVKAAIEELGTGFLRGNPDLHEQLKTGQVSVTTLYRACLKLVYQMVFLFVTEDRDLLFERDETGAYIPDAQTRERATHYLTRALRNKAINLSGNSQHSDAYAGWERLLGHVRAGFAPLGLPALGSHLFATNELTELTLNNRAFFEAIRALCEITVDGSRRPVNYAGLDSEELGSIYESLLELVPRIQTGGRFELQTLPGNERKTTGSYYTPSSLIDLLLESALDPVIEQAIRDKLPTDAIKALKSLKVIDPACGSGHFLIAAARRIGARLAELEEETSQPSPPAVRRATRSVIAHCIYGADINPMAVELAKVALWLEGQDAGKPLAFLDHRLRVGNSLLGTTPELMNAEDEIPEKVIKKILYKAAKAKTFHLPDDAFSAIEGDDRATVAALKKRNKQEREAMIKISFGDQALAFGTLETATIFKEYRELDAIEPDSIQNVKRQEEKFADIQRKAELKQSRLLADAWCAAFVAPKIPNAPAITTATLNDLKENPNAERLELVRALVQSIADQYRFSHPHLEFPDVFTPEQGGFDCVLGNPPWEHTELKEKEWFMQRSPDIAEAATGAERKKMIAELGEHNPLLFQDFLFAKREHDALSFFISASKRYPLTARGRINTYAIFSEANRDSLNPRGRMGIIVPTGIATDDTTKFFFQDLMDKQALSSLYDFENRNGIFCEVHRSFKFCVLSISGSQRPNAAARFVFFALDAEETKDPNKLFVLSPNDIALLNPNTRTAPIFRNSRDATITKNIYQRVPVLLNETTNENPWGVTFKQGLFNMTSDSGLFRTAKQLEEENWKLEKNQYQKDGAIMLPLYEAKLMHQFDHRFATYTESGDTRDLTTEEKIDPDRLPLPRYWVKARDVEDGLVQTDKTGNATWEWENQVLPAFRRVARSTDERSGIFTLLPPNAAGDSVFIAFPDSKNSKLLMAFYSSLNSFVADFVTRQKVAGMNLSFFYIQQFPVLPPSVYTPERLAFISPRVLELTYTAHDLTGFARDIGYTGDPFTWNDDRRFWLRAELDALYFILYGIERDDVTYIMDTFPIVRRKDVAAHGSYRTKDAILKVYDELQNLGLSRLNEYQSKVPGGPVAGGWNA